MICQLSYEAITISVAANQAACGADCGRPSEKGCRRRKRDEKNGQGSVTKSQVLQSLETMNQLNSVVDFFATMIEEAAPKYLPFSKCVSREQELMSQRVDKRTVALEDQKLQVKNTSPDITADLSTDLKLQNAFHQAWHSV